MRKKLFLALMCLGALSFTACGSNNTGTDEPATVVKNTESEPVKETETETKDDTENIVDMKNYNDEFSEDFGGSLAKRLSIAINGSNDFTYDESSDEYVIVEGKLTIRTSDIGDGYFVTLTDKVDNFTIYGLSVGTSNSDVNSILEANGVTVEPDDGGYTIDDNTYLMIDMDDNAVTSISYVKYLG